MKIGWERFATRKDRLETVGGEGMGLTPAQATEAWYRLMEKMIDLSSPEAPKLPKFNDVLLSVVAAIVRGRKTHSKYGTVSLEILVDCDRPDNGHALYMGSNPGPEAGVESDRSQARLAPEYLP